MAEGCVYVLYHVHPETEQFEEEGKMIGIYDTERGAEGARARVKDKPGFRDHLEGFTIAEHRLNRDGWAEGTIRV